MQLRLVLNHKETLGTCTLPQSVDPMRKYFCKIKYDIGPERAHYVNLKGSKIAEIFLGEDPLTPLNRLLSTNQV